MTKSLSHSKRTFNLHDVAAMKIESQLPNEFSSEAKPAPASTVASVQQSLTSTYNQKSSTARLGDK